MNPFLKMSIGARVPDLHSGLRVAVGHLTVDAENIEGSFGGSPNVSRQRRRNSTAGTGRRNSGSRR